MENQLKALVSFIVPIYNVEKYIQRCVKSIVEQDYPRIEIILVDDGSKDHSAALIDQMALEDKRIKVIHKENEGVSSARNSGLKIAKGEYVVFVDGDDYLEKDYASYFLELVVSNHCEMAVGENNFNIREQEQILRDAAYVADSLYVIEAIYSGDINVAVWNKIYKKSFLDKNKILFHTDFWYGEGMLFNVECLQYIDKVVVGKRRVYHQVYNKKSATRDFNLKSCICGIRSLEYQKKHWIKKNKHIEDAWEYHYKSSLMSIIRGLVKTNTTKEYESVLKKCKKNLRSDWWKMLIAHLSFKKKMFLIVSVINPVAMAKRQLRKEKRAIIRC